MSNLLFLCVLKVALTVLFALITAFFALHAAQRVVDPSERAVWLLIIVPFTLFGSAFYAFTKYRAFRRVGKGGLIRNQSPKTLRVFLELSPSEGADSSK